MSELLSIAGAINAYHQQAREHALTAVECARRAGKLLLDAKASLGHGKWLPWLRENLALSERTAQGYMRLAALPEAKAQRVAGLSLRQALTSVADRQAAGPPDNVRVRDEIASLEAQATTLDDDSLEDWVALREAAEALGREAQRRIEAARPAQQGSRRAFHSYPAHPLLEAFLPLEEDEFESLVFSIKRAGLIDPIVVYDEVILDGRQRLRACLAAGVEPRFVEYSGRACDVWRYIIDVNTCRKHVTDAELTAVARVFEELTGSPPPGWRESS